MRRMIRRNERGGVAVWVALSIIPLLVVVGLVADVGMLYWEKGQLQNGADSAALAVAQEDGPLFELAPGFRAWRDRSFADQTAKLREAWLSATDWIEGRGRTELAVWGADWRGFRLRLRALLDELVPTTPGTEPGTS